MSVLRACFALDQTPTEQMSKKLFSPLTRAFHVTQTFCQRNFVKREQNDMDRSTVSVGEEDVGQYEKFFYSQIDGNMDVVNGDSGENLPQTEEQCGLPNDKPSNKRSTTTCPSRQIASQMSFERTLTRNSVRLPLTQDNEINGIYGMVHPRTEAKASLKPREPTRTSRGFRDIEGVPQHVAEFHFASQRQGKPPPAHF